MLRTGASIDATFSSHKPFSSSNCFIVSCNLSCSCNECIYKYEKHKESNEQMQGWKCKSRNPSNVHRWKSIYYLGNNLAEMTTFFFTRTLLRSLDLVTILQIEALPMIRSSISAYLSPLSCLFVWGIRTLIPTWSIGIRISVFRIHVCF